MARKKKSSVRKSTRRQYTDEFKEEAVQLLLDGYTAPQVVDRLGIVWEAWGHPNCIDSTRNKACLHD